MPDTLSNSTDLYAARPSYMIIAYNHPKRATCLLRTKIMATISSAAQKIYQHLTIKVIPTKKVTTYGDVSTETGVRIGVEGGTIGSVLGEVARACEEHKLP